MNYLNKNELIYSGNLIKKAIIPKETMMNVMYEPIDELECLKHIINFAIG